jgi:hypothetical protein
MAPAKAATTKSKTARSRDAKAAEPNRRAAFWEFE